MRITPFAEAIRSSMSPWLESAQFQLVDSETRSDRLESATFSNERVALTVTWDRLRGGELDILFSPLVPPEGLVGAPAFNLLELQCAFGVDESEDGAFADDYTPRFHAFFRRVSGFLAQYCDAFLRGDAAEIVRVDRIRSQQAAEYTAQFTRRLPPK